SPPVAQRQQVEGHRLAAADHSLRRQRFLGLTLIEDEAPVAQRVDLLHRLPPVGRSKGWPGAARRLGCPSFEDISNDAGQATGLVSWGEPYRCGTAPGSIRTSLSAAPPAITGPLEA